MPTIHDQLSWEGTMVDHGVSRYRAQQDAAIKGDRTHETSAGSRLLRSYVLQISDHISLYLAGKHPDGRRRGKYAKLLATVNTDKAALMALKAVIAAMFNPQSLQSLCINIGKVIEDDLRFMKFETEHKEYYAEIIRQFEARGSTNYRYQKRALSHAQSSKEQVWREWLKEEQLGVGATVIGLMMEVCDLIEKKIVNLGNNRKEVSVVPTQACVDWVMQHNEQMELAHPDRMPCVVPPQDWCAISDGGYYSPALRSRTPLVKMRGKSGSAQAALFATADMSKVFTAINAMQNTGWELNTPILEVMREVWHKDLGIGMPRSQPYEVPPSPLSAEDDPSALTETDPRKEAFLNWKINAREIHIIERERVAKNLALTRTMRMAGTLTDYSVFYYVYQCDFRGRVYAATTGLSPQGTDHGKALLRFHEGKALGQDGLFWLKVHGANKYGKDKMDYPDRVKWIDDNAALWLAVAEDPVSARDHWKDADKPYQFLAFCLEYAGAVEHGAAFVSHLPVALDGSCNGLQHFSAMLRDSIGGAAVNLIPMKVPADIYQNVGDVATRKLIGLRSLNDEHHAGAVNWMALFESMDLPGIPRKLPKPPVMTMPYGSTRQACTDSIFRWLQDTAPDFFDKSTNFRHSMYLSPIIWGSIGEVVVAARQAMDWVQECAGILAKAGHPLEYTSPLGFPVYQATYNYKTRNIETQISGRLCLSMAEDTDELSARKQRQGSSPNLVHHVDACHMQMCLNAGAEAGITSFAMIHDDFGVHACDIKQWHRIIREQFVKLHGDHDVLADFKIAHEERHGITLPALPARGTLQIEDVLKSEFFFG
ncbi:DNA-directed RNA polymerase [Pseudorhodobacter antarcticus]|uniref:DNA-directed RNA polymerase n=1 Tax=Pseudorhodobacter antarcticus TaxID=1077947 RepID=A0A1H8IIB1_9RHOB|nr:DNA-directed RNA polymerase [Pseudorhodobacter antarcticus]SEN68254.1 DNA-directed RNA polymerase [Pseudorhodobacter antarcticus]